MNRIFPQRLAPLLGTAAVLLAWAALTHVRSEPVGTESTVEPPPPVRDVRVLLVPSTRMVRVRAEGPIVIEPVEGEGAATVFSSSEWVKIRPGAGGGLSIADGSDLGPAVAIATESPAGIALTTPDSPAKAAKRRYPGRLLVSITEGKRLRVVNAVGVERYVAGVVAAEVWPTFHVEAYRAQAIASRTFVLYQMERRRNASFDVRATQGSQVYTGLRSDRAGRQALAATEYTRGIVCTWRDSGRDRLFSTYYSAACGGESQSARIFGENDDVPPLAGGVKCDYCRIAPGKTYRWGPVRLNCGEVLRRIVARYPECSSLGAITDIRTIERTPGGRAIRLRIEGSSGEHHELLAEHFRLAVGASTIRSTDCDIKVSGRDVIFANGRGFGHGLGMCQWGMQGQALEGKRAADILRYYYPGSKLTRAY